MMPSKLYLLLTILFVFVICSKSAEQKPRKDDSEQKVVVKSGDDDYAKDKDKDEDDDDAAVDDNSALTALPFYRYQGYDSKENNYRTRSRWPAPGQSESSSYGDYGRGNDRPRFDLGNFLASLPIGPYDNNANFNRGPACYSLIDPQYTIFSDTCGAVPQARYTLPNAFGHRERWQIAQILTALMSASTQPTCTRSLRLLMCPMLFPPCPNRHEPPAVLPCQSFCRAVKARCAIPALEFLPCEVLPYSSDLCPTNQPYGSFMPPGAFPPVPSPAIADAFSAARSFPSLQSLLSSQNLQAAFASSPSFQQAAFAASPFSSVPSSSFQQAAFAASPFSSVPSSSLQQAAPRSPSLSPVPSSSLQQAAPTSPSLSSGSSPSLQQVAPASPPLSSGLSSSLQQVAPASPPLSSGSSPSLQQAAPANLYNGGPYAANNFNQMLNELPSRPYGNNYLQAPRFAPVTRSSTETRVPTETRSATPSTVVKA